MTLENFKADRCYYCEIENEKVIIRQDASKEGMPSLKGIYELGASPIFSAGINAGKRLVVDNIYTTELMDEGLRETCIQLQIISYIIIPVIKDKTAAGLFCIVQSSSRIWTELEVELLSEAADRIWASIEKGKSEEALQKSEAHLITVFKALPVGAAVINTRGEVILSNEDMDRYLPSGIIPSRDENYWRWKAFDSNGEVIKPHDFPGAKALRGETTFPGLEMLYRNDEGEELWTLVTYVPIKDANGEILGMVCVITDIDDLKRSTEKLLQSEEQLKQFNLLLEDQVNERTRELNYSKQDLQEKNEQLTKVNTELESFNYIASHDLQEPLRKIQTFIDRIENINPEKESVTNYFDKISKSSKRMSALINSLLEYSRLSTPEQHKEVDLNETLKDVKTDLELLMQEKHASIIAENLSVIIANKIQMYQLFLNLISNAIKFSDKKPQINITSEQVSGAEIPFYNNNKPLPEKNYILLIFSDNGIGFDQKYSDKIFELFQRLHGKSAYAGTGIGLSIVKRIVDNHNGFISASSVLGEGSVFKVWLPVDSNYESESKK